MGYLERRIEMLEDRLDSSMQRNGSAIDHMETLDELCELRSELRCRSEMGRNDDIAINRVSEKYEKKQSVMRRIFDCLKKVNSNHHISR